MFLQFLIKTMSLSYHFVPFAHYLGKLAFYPNTPRIGNVSSVYIENPYLKYALSKLPPTTENKKGWCYQFLGCTQQMMTCSLDKRCSLPYLRTVSGIFPQCWQGNATQKEIIIFSERFFSGEWILDRPEMPSALARLLLSPGYKNWFQTNIEDQNEFESPQESQYEPALKLISNRVYLKESQKINWILIMMYTLLNNYNQIWRYDCSRKSRLFPELPLSVIYTDGKSQQHLVIKAFIEGRHSKAASLLLKLAQSGVEYTVDYDFTDLAVLCGYFQIIRLGYLANTYPKLLNDTFTKSGWERISLKDFYQSENNCSYIQESDYFLDEPQNPASRALKNMRNSMENSYSVIIFTSIIAIIIIAVRLRIGINMGIISIGVITCLDWLTDILLAGMVAIVFFRNFYNHH